MSKNALARALGRRFSAEDDTPTEDLPVEQVEEIGETPDAAVAEVTEAEGEVAADTEVLEEQQEAAEGLESIYLAIQAAAGEGGLQPGEAALINGWTRSIVGQEAAALALPSLESFGGTSGRMSATNASLEGVGQMLKDVWAAIMKQIRKVIASIRNWYLKVLDSAPRLKKRAAAIKDRSGDMTGTPEKNKLELGLLRQLQINEASPNKAAVVAGTAQLVKLAEAVLSGESNKTYENEQTRLVGYLESPDAASNAAKAAREAAKAVVELIGGEVGATHSVSGDRFGTENEAKLSAPMLGGKAVVACIAKDDGGKVKHYVSNTKLDIVVHAVKPKDLAGTGTFDTLAPSDAGKICDEVIKICDQIIAYKKLWESRENQVKAVEAAGKKAVADLERDKENDSTKVAAARDAMGALNSATMNGIRFQTSTIGYCIKTSQALLSYCEKSLAQYKTK